MVISCLCIYLSFYLSTFIICLFLFIYLFFATYVCLRGNLRVHFATFATLQLLAISCVSVWQELQSTEVRQTKVIRFPEVLGGHQNISGGDHPKFHEAVCIIFTFQPKFTFSENIANFLKTNETFHEQFTTWLTILLFPPFSSRLVSFY